MICEPAPGSPIYSSIQLVMSRHRPLLTSPLSLPAADATKSSASRPSSPSSRGRVPVPDAPPDPPLPGRTTSAPGLKESGPSDPVPTFSPRRTFTPLRLQPCPNAPDSSAWVGTRPVLHVPQATVVQAYGEASSVRKHPNSTSILDAPESLTRMQANRWRPCLRRMRPGG